MAVWVIRAGSMGENEEFALKNELYRVGPGVNQGVWEFVDRKALKGLIQEQPSLADEVWRFAREVKVGEIVVMPLKETKPKNVVVGRIVGDYVYCYVERRDESLAPLTHTRKVEWLAKGVPLENFDEDIQKSFENSHSNVVRVRKPNSEARVEQAIRAYIDD